MLRGRLVCVFVHSHHKHRSISRWCRDDDLLGSALQMSTGFLYRGKHSRRLDHIFCSFCPPRDGGRITAVLCVCVRIHVFKWEMRRKKERSKQGHVYMSMRDAERRKKEASKVIQTTKQHSTPKVIQTTNNKATQHTQGHTNNKATQHTQGSATHYMTQWVLIDPLSTSTHTVYMYIGCGPGCSCGHDVSGSTIKLHSLARGLVASANAQWCSGTHSKPVSHRTWLGVLAVCYHNISTYISLPTTSFSPYSFPSLSLIFILSCSNLPPLYIA